MIWHYLKGWLFWHSLKLKYGINYRKAVIVLSGENNELDRQVLRHLSDFICRKHAESVMIFCKTGQVEAYKDVIKERDKTIIYEMKNDEIMLLYSFYSFMKYFDNIVFTYTDTPKDNLLGRYLRETDINEEEAACLALYHLREVPRIREKEL